MSLCGELILGLGLGGGAPSKEDRPCLQSALEFCPPRCWTPNFGPLKAGHEMRELILGLSYRLVLLRQRRTGPVCRGGPGPGPFDKEAHRPQPAWQTHPSLIRPVSLLQATLAAGQYW